MKKRAIIYVSLVPEARGENDETIRKQIMEESSIPFCAEIKKVSIEVVEDNYKKLRGHGLSKRVARNVIRFYES